MTRIAWLGLIAWVAVVAGSSGLAWVAIDHAGRDVTPSTGSNAVLDPSALATLPTGSPTSVQHQPTVAPSSARPSRHPASASSRPQRPSSPPAPVGTVRTWNGTAGTMTVGCSGGSATLVGASPADGWQAQRRDDVSGPALLLSRGGTRILVHARCVQDVPVFSSAVNGGEPHDE